MSKALGSKAEGLRKGKQSLPPVTLCTGQGTGRGDQMLGIQLGGIELLKNETKQNLFIYPMFVCLFMGKYAPGVAVCQGEKK